MAQETEQLRFTCYKCSTENFYPAKQGDDQEGGKTLVKRCTNCGAENKIELPDGWVAARTEVIHRGTKSTGEL